MPEFPRDLPHLYLGGSGKAEPYTSKRRAGAHKLPQRDRAGHAETLRIAIEGAFAAGEVRRQERDPNLAAGRDCTSILKFHLAEKLRSNSSKTGSSTSNLSPCVSHRRHARHLRPCLFPIRPQ